ncbi:hypothetical protein [Aquimarina sp. 2201CG5-10]|uniref:hypothetical protein n=1 Tax=Aquimarina callyspongiae TaxID=3098150 RepID=UPI002AB4E3A1|nr:hypothetical protein [Aquimarina sp. 2201CG5-10]MDY8134941.1 hypothetical protein [Aquimarina sp. 2201CG5-10]
MNTTQNTSVTFYQNLGKLFYAIAAADKFVHKSELASLQKVVKSEWLPIDSTEDEFGVDLAFQIETVFDWMDNEEISADLCFQQFEVYFKEHTSLFTNKIKQLIWTTSNNIAGAFSGKNKSELMMLGRLKLLLES